MENECLCTATKVVSSIHFPVVRLRLLRKLQSKDQQRNLRCQSVVSSSAPDRPSVKAPIAYVAPKVLTASA